MTFRSRRPARGARRKKNYLWTSALADKVDVGVGSTVTTILQPTDWERSAQGFERATLTRIRGYIAFYANTLGTAQCFNYIGVYDEDESSSLADVVATYDSEDILWTWGSGQVSTIEAIRPTTVVVDVRVKRRLTSAQEIRLVSSASAADIISYNCVLRALVDLT